MIDAKRLASTVLRQVDEWISPAFRAAFKKLDEQDGELAELRERVERLEREKPEGQ